MRWNWKRIGRKIRQNLDIAELPGKPGSPAAVVIEQHDGPADGLLREWPGRTPASRSTLPMRCSGTRSPCWPWFLAVVLAFGKNEDFSNKLLLIGVVCALPWCSARSPTSPLEAGRERRYGELIAPRALSGAVRATARQGSAGELRRRACDARCERKLYYLRQCAARRPEMERVERLWVVTDSAVPRTDLFPAIEGTYVAADRRVVPSFPNVAEHIYLVDPLGNLMLRFPPDPILHASSGTGAAAEILEIG